ncbi:MAG: TRAP transporter small permease [Ostreibacterium sp.]
MAIGKQLDTIYRLAAYCAGALLILLTLLVLYSIFARLIGAFSGGATDMAGYVMEASTFMALPYTFRSNGHIRVALLIDKLDRGKRRVFELFVLAFMLILSVYFAWYMIRLAWDSYDFGVRSEGADMILLWIPQTPVAVGTTLFAIAVLHSFIEVICHPGKVIEAGEEI